jgi:hypothetical protein
MQRKVTAAELQVLLFPAPFTAPLRTFRIMTDRKVFNLFYGAREGKPEMYKGAYESGADVNFAFEGRKAMRGGAGRWYYGDLIWYTKDGVDGEKKDTLLHIAVKSENIELVSWLLSLER